MPKPGPRPRPNPPPMPTTSNRIISNSTAWTSAEMPTKVSVRPARARVVESRTTGGGDMKREATRGLTGGTSCCQAKAGVAPILPAEPGSQRACLRAAHGHLAAGMVAHDELVATAEPGDDLLHVVEVHEAGLVDPEEHLGVEALFQLAKRVVGHECPLAGGGEDEPMLDPEPANVVDRQQEDAAPAVHRDLRGERLAA